MITIEEVREFIRDFNPPVVNEFGSNTNAILQYRRYATALDLLDSMVSNQIDKIEEPYFVTNPGDIECIKKDYADILGGKNYLFQHYPIAFIVLDERTPLFMTKVNIDMHLWTARDGNETETTFTNMYDPGLWFFSLYREKDEQGKLGSYDAGIRRFIEDSIIDRDGIFKKYGHTNNAKQSPN